MNRALLRLISIGLLLVLLGVTFVSLRTLRRLPSVSVYFVKAGPTSFTLEPVNRLATGNTPQAKLEAALENLIAGPTSEEQKQGLSTSFPQDAQVLGLELNDSNVQVNLSQSFEQGGGSAAMLGRLNQLFYTLTEPEEITSVTLLVEGKELSVFSGQGLLINNPWQRPSNGLPIW